MTAVEQAELDLPIRRAEAEEFRAPRG